MQIKREKSWRMFDINWCVACGKVTDMEQIRTGLPGIQSKKCNGGCNSHYQANFLEDAEDMVNIKNLENAVLPTDEELKYYQEKQEEERHASMKKWKEERERSCSSE